MDGEKRFRFWQTWLFVVSLLVSVFGLMMLFFGGTRLFGVFNRQIDPAFWATGMIAKEARAFQHWIYGLLGATMASWGVVMAYIARYPFRKRERWSTACLAAGLLVWFLADTSISLVYKVYFNVVFNVVVLTLAAMPVIFTQNDFKQ